ncbi:MAG: hypothetical protein VX874_18720 [Pseudomonadota bacterium]|nr:hypothetical protein [Pseudomonadota bacterium]
MSLALLSGVFAAGVTVFVVPLFAKDLPIAGQCEYRRMSQGTYISTDRYVWEGEVGRVEMLGKTHEAQVVGLRPYDEHFKLSLRYTDEIVGDAELVIFALERDGPVEYRVGRVSYDTLDDGTRVVSTIRANEPLTCEVRY